MTSADHANYQPCAGPEGPYCKTLLSRLSDSRVGLTVFETVRMSTGERQVHGVVHRLRTRDEGLMLNHCPWCGVRIAPRKAGT